MKLGNFVETGQVTALRQAISEAMDAGAGYPTILMAYGEAGMGKTWAARKLHAGTDLGGCYMRAMEGMTQNAFLQELCFEITGTRPTRSMHCKQAIIKKLQSEPVPIFADEIERLAIGRLEDLRDITDMTGAPVILIGELALPTRVAARERINDRIPEAYRIKFDAIKAKDIMFYAKKAADLSLTPEAGSVVFDSTKGNFRRVDNAVLSLKKAARAYGSTEISADMASKVLKSKGGN